MAKNTKITTVFFGLDGVVVDTQSYYDSFWNRIAKENGLKIENFASTIKGMTQNSIIDLYFTLLTPEEKQAIRKACEEEEKSINYKELLIPGITDFIQYLKKENYKIGLVTSSSLNKVNVVKDQLNISGVFDTVITAESIKRGKPDPMGYILAMTNLGVQSSECIVFEDTFNGIKAATYAFMRVIGVSKGAAADFLKDYTYATIPDFRNESQLKTLLA